MSSRCDGHSQDQAALTDRRFRRALWIALAINAGMFGLEIASGLVAQSVSLQADALDFFGDAANYALSLMVLGMSMRWRSAAALVKGTTMGLFGFWVIGQTVWHFSAGTLPGAAIMGSVGFLALIANVASAFLLFAFRTGDSNMRSVWLCSRNDAIGNIAVILAAGGVVAAGAGWPDLLVAAVLAGLALSAAFLVFRQAIGELRRPAVATE